MTFAEHFRLAAGLANVLVERYGIQKGDRVAIAMRNLPEWVIAFWAAIAAGAVVVPRERLVDRAEFAYGLADSGPSVVFVDEERQGPDPPPPRRDPRPHGHGRLLRGARPRRAAAGRPGAAAPTAPAPLRCPSSPSPS